MNIVRARPVARSIQSGGVTRAARTLDENEFDELAAVISPVRFQPMIARANSARATPPAR